MPACDCGSDGKKHLNGCASLDDAPPAKRRRQPRGPKCPVCGAVMSGSECAFKDSHASTLRNRAAAANARGDARRGTSQPPATARQSARYLREARAAQAAERERLKAERKAAADEAKRQRKQGRG
jgi:hypothetical protein